MIGTLSWEGAAATLYDVALGTAVLDRNEAVRKVHRVVNGCVELLRCRSRENKAKGG